MTTQRRDVRQRSLRTAVQTALVGAVAVGADAAMPFLQDGAWGLAALAGIVAVGGAVLSALQNWLDNRQPGRANQPTES